MMIRATASALLSILLLVVAGCATSSAMASAEPVAPSAGSERPASVIVFVRHAEKASDGSDDPPLTEQGQQRAQCLVHELDGFAPTALWSTQYERTRQTLAPLADAVGKSVEVLDASDDRAWIDKLSSTPAGSHVVVAAHSNTIPGWVRALGGDPGPLDGAGNIPEDEFDRIIFVVVDARGDHVATIVHRYC